MYAQGLFEYASRRRVGCIADWLCSFTLCLVLRLSARRCCVLDVRRFGAHHQILTIVVTCFRGHHQCGMRNCGRMSCETGRRAKAITQMQM